MQSGAGGLPPHPPHLSQTRPVREHGLGTTRQASFRRISPMLTRPYMEYGLYTTKQLHSRYLAKLLHSRIKNLALRAQYVVAKTRPPIYHITFTSPSRSPLAQKVSNPSKHEGNIMTKNVTSSQQQEPDLHSAMNRPPNRNTN